MTQLNDTTTGKFLSSMIDIRGVKFGFLLAVHRIKKMGQSYWKCLCNCGSTCRVREIYLINKHTKSCGCRKGKYIDGRSKKPEYDIWYAMIRRCKCKEAINYYLYGGRGIKVCKRWNRYENFVKDMGVRPSSKHSVERIDNNGDYEPSNCCWATRSEQDRNKSNNVIIEAFGLRLSMVEWCQKTGINWNTLDTRINKLSWSISDALSKPVRSKRKSKCTE